MTGGNPMSAKKTTQELELNDVDELLNVFGRNDEHLKLIQQRTGATIVHRDGKVSVGGPAGVVREVGRVLEDLRRLHRMGRNIERNDVQYSLMLFEEHEERRAPVAAELLLLNGKGRAVRPRTPTQNDYVQAITSNDLVFGIGPAGTGKTYLAVACAVQRLFEHRANRIIVCRPAVEAGEKLGFLPGDFQQKVDPYLRPIYDALFDIISPDKASKLIERGSIEVAPLAYMRGRTLEHCFAILDEAQNTTVEQMKMFLTRLGRGSSAVVTGDITQIDLPAGKVCGLTDAAERLRGVPGIKFINFSRRDVVRHDLVGRIIEAYQDETNAAGENLNGNEKTGFPEKEGERD